MVVVLIVMLGLQAGLLACGDKVPLSEDSSGRGTLVVVDTSFLADIVSHVAGSACRIVSLLPEGVDPHSFEPTPRDAATIAEADAVVVTYLGLEPKIVALLEAAAKKGCPVIDVSTGIPGVEEDPHVWLDPVLVRDHYLPNLVKGLSSLLPEAETVMQSNAEDYRRKLDDLDRWIEEQVNSIPQGRRLLVTNHETFGWFARRYGFTVVGTLLPGQHTEGAPSAERLASLVAAVKQSGAPAVFLETGSEPDLADQIARETGVSVVTDLYTHSLGEGVRSYIEMMEWNVKSIVDALR